MTSYENIEKLTHELILQKVIDRQTLGGVEAIVITPEFVLGPFEQSQSEGSEYEIVFSVVYDPTRYPEGFPKTLASTNLSGLRKGELDFETPCGTFSAVDARRKQDVPPTTFVTWKLPTRASRIVHAKLRIDIVAVYVVVPHHIAIDEPLTLKFSDAFKIKLSKGRSIRDFFEWDNTDQVIFNGLDSSIRLPFGY